MGLRKCPKAGAKFGCRGSVILIHQLVWPWGYGSILGWMNIHLPPMLMFTGFDPQPYIAAESHDDSAVPARLQATNLLFSFVVLQPLLLCQCACFEPAMGRVASLGRIRARAPLKLHVFDVWHMAMGQKPVPPVNIPIPTKIDLNGWCTYPKMVPLVLTHSHIGEHSSWYKGRAGTA